ncbi:MAG: magnesium transporter CorA family protein [Chloroflexi bacterium]|nr:magnesium transporter CorA family protein [Chloroflexota bacterium]
MATAPDKQKEEKLNMESVNWGGLTWFNIERPTQREMDYLAQHYPFNSFDLEDCLSRRQQSKLDVYKDYLFLIFQFSVWDSVARVSKSDKVSVFVGKDYLITVHDGQLKPLVNLFRDCQSNEEIRHENLNNGSGYLLYRILDRVIDYYFPILGAILAWIDDVEDAVFDETVETGPEVAALRRDIITQRRILRSVRTASIDLEKQIGRFSKVDLTVPFGDFMDHVNKSCETLDEYTEIIEIFKDTDFVLSTDRLNHIMRVMTVIATVFLPFIVISSIYGMNIHLPGSVNTGSWMPFVIIILSTSLITGVMLYYFRRRRWI